MSRLWTFRCELCDYSEDVVDYLSYLNAENIQVFRDVIVKGKQIRICTDVYNCMACCEEKKEQ